MFTRVKKGVARFFKKHEWFNAAFGGDIVGIVKLLQQKSEYIQIDMVRKLDGWYEWTALTGAASNGHREVVKVLITAGANVNISLPWYVQKIVEGTAVQESANTVLHVAAIKGWADVAALLLANGAVLDAVNSVGDSPLHCAAETGNLDVVEVLLQHKANVHLKNKEGNTPLHIAAQNDRIAIVDRLITAQADVNAVNAKQETALHLAAIAWLPEMVGVLLAKGAALNAQDSQGGTALYWAVAYKRTGHVYDHFRCSEPQIQTVEALLVAHADLEIKAVGGWTALHWAVMLGRKALVERLLIAGANTQIKNDVHETVLHMIFAASRYSYDRVFMGVSGEDEAKAYVAIMQLLLAQPLDLEARDHKGRTALVAGKRYSDRPDYKLLNEQQALQRFYRAQSGNTGSYPAYVPVSSAVTGSEPPPKYEAAVVKTAVPPLMVVFSGGVDGQQTVLAPAYEAPILEQDGEAQKVSVH